MLSQQDSLESSIPRQQTPNEAPAPKESGLPQQPQANPPGQLDSLKSALERAKAGGRPLNIVQIGDSHVASGVQTTSLASRLAADAGLQPSQVQYTFTGARGKSASYANENSGQFLRHINKNTDLVVVSFGSNEAGQRAGAKFTNDYSSLIQKIRNNAPQAAIVMAGPTDGNFSGSSRHLPYLDSVAQAQHEVAAQVPDSAYVNVGPQMGSVSSMRARGVMASDNLHLTAKGYQHLGSIIADNIEAEMRRQNIATPLTASLTDTYT
jgi:lysophospholipase L1-like esterase